MKKETDFNLKVIKTLYCTRKRKLKTISTRLKTLLFHSTLSNLKVGTCTNLYVVWKSVFRNLAAFDLTTKLQFYSANIRKMLQNVVLLLKLVWKPFFYHLHLYQFFCWTWESNKQVYFFRFRSTFSRFKVFLDELHSLG